MKLFKRIIKQAFALVLCAVLALGGLPISFTPSASAAWYDSYMTKMKSWGIINDGRGNDRITRAEMAAVLKRAFGFTRTGSIPFKDVKRSDWFYYDIATLYNEGIFTGTSRTTAAPHSPVTREQILTFIGRCLRYEESPGKITEFTDGNSISSWSSKYVRTALLNGIMSGYSDGSFKPKNYATRGEVAKMMSIAMGNLVNKKGETELGTVFGNVTLNTTGATLSNTTIVGNLYLTGGVGLGNVVLDNVTVLGKIIVAGGGNSESSQASIILKNVKAHQLVIDPSTGQFVSLRAIGNTYIPETLVKSSAYIKDDVRNPELGLQDVFLNAAKGSKFTIAGNMKNVINQTPKSTLIVGDTGTGSVTSITVDEKATDSRVNLNVNAVVDEINLDTLANVTGKGDIIQLNIAADGCTSEILPEQVWVRDDCVAQVGGISPVDNAVAQELSSEPNILAGYPKLKNIAPTTATALVAGNKPGTIYWALTVVTRGPVEDADKLIAPDYGSGFRASGSIKVNTSKTEFPISLSGLSRGGSYYISAVLVDGYGHKSPIKSQLFTTPDDTTPALTNKNYPTIVDLTPTRTDANAHLPFSELADLQATVMANKNCDLYYVLLDTGSTAPTADEFLSGAFSDPYGFGKIPLQKNTMDVFNITDVMDVDGNHKGKGNVKEKTSYDLYVLLSDGEKNSTITKKTITTKDITPPEFIRMDQTDAKTTSVTISGAVDEDSTVYWLTFPNGTYPEDRDGGATPNQAKEWERFLHSDWAKILVANGYGKSTSKSGKVNAKAGQQFTFNVTGLKQNSAYDLYYVALDKAGNYSDPVEVLSIHTLDTIPPTATQEFLNVPDDMDPNNVTPYAYSTINVIFDEEILYRQPGSSTANPYPETNLLKLYQNYDAANKNNPDSEETAYALQQYVGALRDMIVLYSDSTGKPVTERKTGSAETGWTIDYRYTRVYKDDTNLVVSFLHNDANPNLSALNLESGARYHFQLNNITDTSKNAMKPMPQSLPTFRTASAEVRIGQRLGGLSLEAYELNEDGTGFDTSKPIYTNNDFSRRDPNTHIVLEDDETRSKSIPIDISFTAEPRSTSTTADGVVWDMLFWFDNSIKFELFVHEVGSSDPWTQVGGAGAILDIVVPSGSSMSGTSVMQTLSELNGATDYHDIKEAFLPGSLHCGLNDAQNPVYEYAIHVVELNSNPDRKTFNQEIKGQVTFVTGSALSLDNVRPGMADEYKKVTGNQNGVTDVTTPNKPEDLLTEPRLLHKQFEDGRAPQISNGLPQFTETPGGVDISISADRPGDLFYILAPMTTTGNYALRPSNPGSGGTNVPVDQALIKEIVAYSGGAPTMTTNVEEMRNKFPNYTITDDYGFTFPSSAVVITPEGSQLDTVDNRNQLLTDHFPISQAITTQSLTGLKPDTDYLIYIATKGVSNVISPVTVYQFHTNPLAKPILSTDGTGTDATISSNIDAHVTYKLYAYNDTGLPSIFLESFIDNVDTTSEAWKTYSSKTSSWKKVNNKAVSFKSSDYTVLDAMIESIEKNGKSIGSLFDLCASDASKQTVREHILGNISDGGQTLGTAKNQSVTPSKSLDVDCNKLSNNKLTSAVNYCLVICGYSGSANSENQSAYAFTAHYPIATPREQIKVTQVSANVHLDTPDPLNPNNKSYSGTVTIFFSDELNLYSDGTPPRRTPLYARPINATIPSGGQSVQGYTYSSKPNYVAVQVSNNGGKVNRALTFDVNKVDGTFTVGLVGTSYYSGAAGDPQIYPLYVNITIDRNKDSSPVTAITVTQTNQKGYEWSDKFKLL